MVVKELWIYKAFDFMEISKQVNDSNSTSMITNEELNAFFANLEENIKDEAEAREGYYKLMTKFEYLMAPSEIMSLKEIISEELKHTEILNRMIRIRNGILAEN